MPDHKKTWRRFLSRAAIGLGVLAIIALVVVAWMPKPVPVELTVVKRGPLQVSIQEDGRARVKDRHVVSAPLLGTLARLELHAGDDVEEGQVLLRLVPVPSPLLDPRSKSSATARVAAAQAALRQAEAAVARATTAQEFALKEVERQRSLSGHGAVAPQTLERAELDYRSSSEELTSARFGVRVAASEVEMTKAALGIIGESKGGEELLVPSPVGGRVLKVYVESEGVVQPGTPLLELGDPAALELVVDVLSADAVRIPAGAAALIERWGGPGTLAARVRTVEPSAFTRISALGVEEQRVNVVLDLSEPPDRWRGLGDGYRIEARIILEAIDEAVQVPTSSVFRLGEAWAVYRVIDNRIETLQLTLGARNDEVFQVISGLAVGDQVVAYPSASLSDGTRVVGR